MISERRALVWGSDPPLHHRVHTMDGDMWRALTRRMKQKQLGAGVHKTNDIFFSIRLEWQKLGLFQVGRRDRLTPPASSRPLDHGST